MLSPVDYENSTLFGAPTYLIHHLQSVMNAAACLIYNLRCSNHVTDALVSLHLLWVLERILFKTAVLTYKALHGVAPQYLNQFVCAANELIWCRLRSASNDHLLIPAVKQSSIGNCHFRLLVYLFGTVYQHTSLPRHCQRSSSSN